jgi:hypothetical protein
LASSKPELGDGVACTADAFSGHKRHVQRAHAFVFVDIDMESGFDAGARDLFNETSGTGCAVRFEVTEGVHERTGLGVIQPPKTAADDQ